jgi:hypothetical protein
MLTSDCRAIQLPGMMGDPRQTEPMDIDGDVDEVISNDVGGNRLRSLGSTADLRMTRVLTGGSLTTSMQARQAAVNATGESSNLGEQTPNSKTKGIQGRKINQEAWKIKAGENGRELFGVHGKGLPDDDIKQPRWEINSAKESCAKYGVTNVDALTETEARK